MTIRRSLVLLMATCVNANAQSQFDDLLLSSPEFAARTQCVRAEAKEILHNKSAFTSLYSDALDKYDGATPCIGTWAHNEHGPGAYVCGQSPPHFTVGEVEPKSGADSAGLLEGDTLVTVGGKPIQHHLDFELAILASKPGSKIAVTVQRGQDQIQRDVSVGLMPVKPGVASQCVPQP